MVARNRVQHPAGSTHDSRLTLQATISIDKARVYTRYDRMVLGQFVEHFHRQIYGGIYEAGSELSDERGFRTDVLEALRQLRIPIVRWPGGCFADLYHWQDGVGQEREPVFDRLWQVVESNQFGTHEFIEWCREIGAEPYLCTNAQYADPGRIEEMAGWLEYCNVKSNGHYARLRQTHGVAEPYNVKYWSIGNENMYDGMTTPEEWGLFVRKAAQIMRKVDPSIKLIAGTKCDLDWTLSLLRQAGEFLDFVAIHGYWDLLFSENNPSDYATCMLWSLVPEERDIHHLENAMGLLGLGDKLKIAFDEWNLRSWHHPRPFTPENIQARDKNDTNSTYTMADAVFSASFLNICLRHADTVHMANFSPLVNSRGALYVHPEGIVKRTTFHVFEMYSNLLAPNIVDAYVSSDPFTHDGKLVPALDAIVTCGDGWDQMKLAIVNRDPEATVTCSVRIDGIALQGIFDATILSGDSPDAYNDIDRPNRVIPEQIQLAFEETGASIPPHSVVLCQTQA
jgi:alpha-N-arabinofuranosidase